MINLPVSQQNVINTLLLITGFLFSLIFIYVKFISIIEKEYRAAKISTVFSVIFLAPFLLLLVPFIILKIMKVPITAASYTKILLEQLDKHSFGQLFTRFWEVPPSQRVYLAMCFGMYVYNIYQNVLKTTPYNFDPPVRTNYVKNIIK